MASKKRSSVPNGGAGPSRPPKKPKATFHLSESTGRPSKRELELEALVTQLQAENKELKGQLSIVQHTTDVNQTKSKPVGGDQYKIKILGTIGERIHTGSDVKGQDGKLLKAVVYCNNKKVTWDPFALAEFEILVVQGDFCVNDQKSWTAEEFEQNMVKARKEVGVILSGVCRSKFSNGERDLHGLKFKDNSSWADGKKWRLGVRVLGSSNVRILEAISKPFRVLDHHGKASEKPHPPSLTDGVERLERVGSKRASNLKDNGIHKVGQFLQLYYDDQARLLKIVGMKSEDESWKVMTGHAKECEAGPNLCNYIGTSTDDDTSQSGQVDVQDVSTDYMGQLPDTEADADQNARPDLSTVQHCNLIHDQTAGIQDIQQATVDKVFSDSDEQLPSTETDADKKSRSYHNSVQHHNLIEDETSIQEMEQEGSCNAMWYQTLAHENLLDEFKPYNDNSSFEGTWWDQDALINATIHNSHSSPNSEAEYEQWIKEIIVEKALSLKGGIAVICFLKRVMRKRRTG